MVEGKMTDKQFEQITSQIEALSNQLVTVKALILLLAEKTGFSAEDLQNDLDAMRQRAVTMDPGPGEVDPEM